MFYVIDTTSGGYYTGRAAKDGWVSSDYSKAFGYESEEGAQRRADNLNKGRLLHGRIFVVISNG